MLRIFLLILLFISHNSLCETLNIYNWSDYIYPQTIKTFEKHYKIKVNYDVFDSDYILESKLNLDKVSYDILVPSSFPFLARQVKSGIYQKININKIKSYSSLNPEIMKMMKDNDLDGYAVPWMWGTVGIGYNKSKLNNIIVDDLDIIFNVEKLKQVTSCGVEIIDIHNEVIPAALVYLGLDPNSESDSDLNQVRELFKQIRPYITSFHASKYIEDLANGEVCVAFGFSGDIIQAANRAKELSLSANIEYVIPKSNTQIWVDSIAIPKDAKNVDNAYKFINYLLEPNVTADNTNHINFANANVLSNKYIKPEILKNPGIYPNLKAHKLYTLKPITLEVEKKRTKLWLEFTSNNM